MSSIIRSERYAAGLLLGAAIAGLIVANTPIGSTLISVKDAVLGVPAIGLHLSIGEWISDGLLAIFFFIVAVELKHEIVAGELNSFGKALRPAIAAVGGVVVPAVIFLAITAGTGLHDGWPVPTATDIAFALGVLAVFGRGIPSRVRVFLLALAVLDDLIAIVIIALFFTHDAQFGYIALAAISAIVFGLLSRVLRARPPWASGRGSQWVIVTAMIVLALVTWYYVFLSGVHATIAGVVLGLVMARRPGRRATHVLEPYSNALVLPLFAFSAAMVALPQVSVGQLSPAFWGILIALPVGKLLGITAAGGIAAWVAERRSDGPAQTLPFRDILTVAVLGGIGFTVSLLMNTLAFARNQEVVDEGTIAVLLGSGVSMVAAAIVVSIEARRYRLGAELRAAISAELGAELSAGAHPTPTSSTRPVRDE